MKHWSRFMVMVWGLLALLGFLPNRGEALAAAPTTMTVVATNDLVSAPNVGYTLTFSPGTAVNSTNRIVLNIPAELQFPQVIDASAVTISDGTTTVHPALVSPDGTNVYISVTTLTALSGQLKITFAPSFGIGNPVLAGNYLFGLRTDADAGFVNAQQVIGTTSTLLQSLSIDQGTISQTSPITYTTVTSSTYGNLIVHAVPVDPGATVSVTGATYLGWNTYNINIIGQTSFAVNVSTSDKRTAAYTVSITRQYDIAYVQFFNSSYTDGTISGTLSWAQPAGGTLPAGAYYQIALFNDKNEVVSVLADQITSGYTYTLPATPVPSGATRIGVLFSDSGSPVQPQKTVPIWLQSNTGVSLQFKDLDPSGGSINGQLSWKKGADDSQIVHYQILYMTRTGTNTGSSMQLLDTVSKNATGIYNYNLASIPSGAVSFLLGFVNAQGEVAPVYPTAFLFDDRTADSPQPVSANELPAATNLNLGLYVQSSTIVSGQILWSVPTGAASSISSFSLYFTDQNGAKIKPIGSVYYNGSMPSMMYNTTALAIPPFATHIAVYTTGADSSESMLAASGPIGLPDLNNNGGADLSDLVLALKHSANLSVNTVTSLLQRLMFHSAY